MLEHKYKISMQLVLTCIIRFILEYLEQIMKPLSLLVTLFENLKVFRGLFALLCFFKFKMEAITAEICGGRMHINMIRC